MGKVSKREIEKLIRAGKQAGEKAKEENFAIGQPVHIIENGQLISVDKTGKKTVIKTLDEHSVKA
ncbi:hypothetical protein BH10BAC3_BH10BAC3_36980 [soil metagenome]